MMIDEVTHLLSCNVNVNTPQMEAVMEEIMTGTAPTEKVVLFLNALNAKGETIEELTAAVMVMRRHAARIHPRQEIVLDTCGTGGDCKQTFNISTAAAFVASGAGIAVAKHGNRSVSSTSGSADILEALGVNIDMSPQQAQRCLNEIGIVFLFAQSFHPAMKYAMPARKKIGARTIFNVLGPLSNPAGATHQLVGVYDERWAQIIAGALLQLGTAHALVVHGIDGLDEISTMSPTIVFEVKNGAIMRHEISCVDFGIGYGTPQSIGGATAQDNAGLMLELLRGKPVAVRDIVVLNAAGAIYASDAAGSGADIREGIKEGIRRACESIDSGAALRKFEELKEYSLKIR